MVTSRISSESSPGSQECVANGHGAGECTSVHPTIHPAPSPPDAGRYTVPSRFGCQSGDCEYGVRGHLTARYLAAVPRRILLMAQQVWSIQHARRSTLRPRVAAPPKGLKHLILNSFFQGYCISRDPRGKPGKAICYVKLDQLRPWNPTQRAGKR